LIQSLHKGDENFVLQDEGLIDKYLGVKIKQLDDSYFELTQPFLIEQVTSFLGLITEEQMRSSHRLGSPC
jgi:hypothetical protein